jgi:hypothetical protein
MKTKEIVAAELTAPLEAYFAKEKDVDFEIMADALEELSAMYRRKKLLQNLNE